MFEATEPSKIIDLALVKIVLGHLRLMVCLLVIAFFLDCFYYQTVDIELIEFIITGNYWIFTRKARLKGLLLGISAGLDKTSLCALISFLLLIASLLISLI